MRLILGLILAAALAAPAQSKEPRAPTGKWLVDFADAQCLASRNYGTTEQPLLLVFKQPAIGDVMQLAVVRKGGSGSYASQVAGKIAVDGTAPMKKTMISYHVRKLDQRALSVNLPLSEFAAVRAGRSISIDADGDLDEAFQIGGIEPLMKVMDTCVADLRKTWNTEAPQVAQLQQPAIGDVSGIFTSNDYPGIAIAANNQGTVQFVLLIDEQGKVADCTVTQTSGVAALDAQSCAVVKERARFEPAIGADGKPAKASFTQRITWRTE